MQPVGEVDNISSCRAVTMQEILRRLVRIACVRVEIHHDPARLRPSDAPSVIGDTTKLQIATGWEPAISLDRNFTRYLYRCMRKGRRLAQQQRPVG
jgi:GDP-4-dehydro-6-deoxy-D-mannose reductase